MEITKTIKFPEVQTKISLELAKELREYVAFYIVETSTYNTYKIDEVIIRQLYYHGNLSGMKFLLITNLKNDNI